jgi:TonB family protein
MRTILIGLLLLCKFTASGQPTKADSAGKPGAEPEVYSKVEIEAQFKGSFKQFLEKVMMYPEKAWKRGIQGVVIIKFIVDSAGRVTDVSLDETSPQKNKWLVAEAKRVIQLSDKLWLPGYQNDKPVKSFHIQSINFALQ